ncbi:carbohydrate kinase family protein, partial [Actinomadura formosensis]
MAAARLEMPVRFIGSVGDDPVGDHALELLRGEGVGAKGVVRVPGAATGRSFILVADDANQVVATWPAPPTPSARPTSTGRSPTWSTGTCSASRERSLLRSACTPRVRGTHVVPWRRRLRPPANPCRGVADRPAFAPAHAAALARSRSGRGRV